MEGKREQTDIDIFAEDGLSINTISGENLKVLRPDFQQEIDLSKVISDILRDNKDIEELTSVIGKTGERDLRKLIEILMRIAPEAIVKITSILVKQDEEFVLHKLDSHSIMEILLPFSLQKWSKWKSLFQQYKGKLPIAKEKAQQSPSSLPSSGESVDGQKEKPAVTDPKS